MNTSRMTPRGSVVVERVRTAAAASLLVRVALLGTLAIGVTVGSVMAGALVVAPVVARASRPDATAIATRALETATAAITNAIVFAMDARADLIGALPVPVTRYAPPALAIVSIVGALSAIFMRRSTPQRTLAPIEDSRSSANNPARLTPRSAPRFSGKRNKTPRAVEALAATGASTQDIAWRTGLPIDAVQLLLAISTAPRQLQPPTA
jgi:hypothetical protein